VIITGLRSAPPEFVARLREVDPIRDAVSYLEPVWHDTSERWVLYEMVPAYDTALGPTVPLPILNELKGVDPDTIPETCPLVSRRQWLLYQSTGRWARPSWIVQGSKGGHLAVYDTPTIRLCEYLQRPVAPPAAGELPYAPLDERVITQITRMNKLYAAQNDLDEFRRVNTGEGGKKAYAAKLSAARAEYVKFLDDQLEEAAEHFVDAYRAGEYHAVDAPVLDVDWVKKDDQETHNFVQTGNFTLPTDT
jgi:hypothetical protein